VWVGGEELGEAGCAERGFGGDVEGVAGETVGGRELGG